MRCTLLHHAPPSAGELNMMEVWHNGSGFGAAWHLDYIEVQTSASGRVSGRDGQHQTLGPEGWCHRGSWAVKRSGTRALAVGWVERAGSKGGEGF